MKEPRHFQWRVEGKVGVITLSRVGSIAVFIAVACGRAEPAVLEDDRVGVTLRLPALQHDADEVTAIEHAHSRALA